MQQWYQCPQCGAPVAFGVKFCGNCRTQLNWPAQQQQPPPQYQPPQYQPPQQPPPQYQQPQQQWSGYQQQPEPPKKKKTNVWLIGCLGLIVLAAIIGGIVLATGASLPEASPSTSPPTTITAAEQAYALVVADQSTTMSTALTELGDLLQDYRLGDDEWATDVVTQLVKIRMVYNEAMAMTPPSSMTEIHYKYSQGLKHYNTMTDLLAQGIDELDASLIEQAATEMDIGTDYIKEATKLMNDFTESKSK